MEANQSEMHGFADPVVSDDDYSSGFDEAEREFFESNGLMIHPQFYLYCDDYNDYSEYIKQLKKEKVG